jgi:hypothetical protein
MGDHTDQWELAVDPAGGGILCPALGPSSWAPCGDEEYGYSSISPPSSASDNVEDSEERGKTPRKGLDARGLWALADALVGHRVSIVPSAEDPISGDSVLTGTVLGWLGDGNEGGGVHLVDFDESPRLVDFSSVQDWALLETGCDFMRVSNT